MINVAILGYGNLGRGVECAIKQNDDMALKYVFTRRNPESVKILSSDVTVCHVDDLTSKKDEIDVLILCGGSATDLPTQTPEAAKYFNVIDSFDTHAKIPAHFENVNKAAKEGGNVAIMAKIRHSQQDKSTQENVMLWQKKALTRQEQKTR